jgi:hypothetical protein
MDLSGYLSDLSTGSPSCNSGSLFYLTSLALLLVMSFEFLHVGVPLLSYTIG